MAGGHVAASEERFTALYESHYGAVERYLRRRAPDVAVRDAVAEVFLVAWRRIEEVPDRSLPWLYGVARRVLANEFRSRQRGQRLEDKVAGQFNASSSQPDFAEVVLSRLSVATAFDRLAEQDQEALRLVAWEELGIRDAAAAAGCSVPAFAMRLHRARRRLRYELERNDERMGASLNSINFPVRNGEKDDSVNPRR
jgi:RNA polymerase sigma factor (sigma-70 family)